MRVEKRGQIEGDDGREEKVNGERRERMCKGGEGLKMKEECLRVEAQDEEEVARD